MDEQEPTEQEVDAIYAFAANLMSQGNSDANIRENLIVRKGLDPEVADIVVGNLTKHRSKIRPTTRDIAKRNMVIGGVVCAIGIAVTVATYMAASGGGTYVVAWGAIVFGGIQFFKGLAQR